MCVLTVASLSAEIADYLVVHILIKDDRSSKNQMKQFNTLQYSIQ
jgi:hypothetical protein